MYDQYYPSMHPSAKAVFLGNFPSFIVGHSIDRELIVASRSLKPNAAGDPTLALADLRELRQRLRHQL